MLKTELMQPEIVETQEGIHTVYSPEVKEHFHSLYGSMQESIHVFIGNGFNHSVHHKKEIRILEMGFGTGLNAILTFRENQIYKRNIYYTALDIQPLPLTFVSKLNYFEYFGKPLQPVFQEMHRADWFRWKSFGNFSLLKLETDILEHRFDEHYDLIYYDAFSPAHQPGLWSFEIFHKIFLACNPGAVLVTYCAKGDVKRALLAAGFEVETLRGPVGKREMIRGIKKSEVIYD